MARSISKKKRFTVFHRDLFTCQYCGRTPPVVVLVIDHIVPVSKGGDDSQDNLTTSCNDCNSGKSDTDLNAIPMPLRATVAARREAVEQAAAFNEFLIEQRAKDDASAARIGSLWADHFYPNKKGQYTLAGKYLSSVKVFLKRITEAEILDAMDIALSARGHLSFDRAFRYFCGVCWNKIREREGA